MLKCSLPEVRKNTPIENCSQSYSVVEFSTKETRRDVIIAETVMFLLMALNLMIQLPGLDFL